MKAYFEFHKMKLPFSLWISAVFMLIPTLLVPLSLGAKQKDIAKKCVLLASVWYTANI